MNEPLIIAAFLAVVGLLLGGAVMLTRAAGRIGVPIALGFIGLGILAGRGGVGGVIIENYGFAFQFGVVALVLIIFDGGLNTPFGTLRNFLAPSLALATVGVVITAAIVALFARLGGLDWTTAWLVGAVVAPTDAAAVFAALRTSGLTLKSRVGLTLEAESGLNDAAAVLLTLSLTTAALNMGTPERFSIVALSLKAVIEILIGAGAGLGIGLLVRQLLARTRLEGAGLYPVFTLAVALFTYGVPSLMGGSGLLAVYVVAVVLASTELPFRVGILRVHDAFAWLGQIGMFLVLGLLVYPTRVAAAAGPGLELALALTIVARPVAVALCVLPFGYTLREALFIGIVGLRGAVPIVLATIPVMAGVPGARHIFDVVFFVVIVNTLLPGAVVASLARRMHMVAATSPEPAATLVVESSEPMRGSLRSYFVDQALSVCGAALADIPFPDGAAITMIVRGSQLMVAEGSSVLHSGDHVYVLAGPEAEPLVQLLFGRPEPLE